MGADLDCWCLDRRRFKGRDRQDQWHSSFPGASSIQGIDRCNKDKTQYIEGYSRVRAIERNSNWSLKLKIWEAT